MNAVAAFVIVCHEKVHACEKDCSDSSWRDSVGRISQADGFEPIPIDERHSFLKGKTMDENLVKIILAVIGLFSLAAITLKVIRKSKFDSTKTKQTGNIVGGDQAGRDINKA